MLLLLASRIATAGHVWSRALWRTAPLVGTDVRRLAAAAVLFPLHTALAAPSQEEAPGATAHSGDPRHAVVPAARGPRAAHYTVRAATVEAGDDGTIPLHVELQLVDPPRPRVVVTIPVWTPGSYRWRDFPEHIADVRARGAEGAPCEVQRLSPHSWEVTTSNEPAVTISYRVDLSPNDRFMMRGERRRAITYEGPQVYLYVRGHTSDLPCQVRFDLPEGWQQASGLVPLADGAFFAADYDVLADCPVKLGRFQTFGFDAAGARIDVVVDGPGELAFDAEPWLANIRRIVECEAAIFGGTLPVQRYVFLYTASPRGSGGGLEHLNSTTIGVAASQLRRSATAAIGTTAHEFFHLWNVKRIRPRELGPFDYATANRTRALWLAEGVTSYYGNVTMARTGVDDEQTFWRKMARQISNLESNPARRFVSSEDSSLHVWEPSPPDRSLDYYNSGLVLGLALDLELRRRTDNRCRLDDVMRALYRLCEERGAGFAPGEIATMAGAVAGSDLRPWFDRHVTGTVPPAYAALLAAAGIGYEEERRTSVVLRGLQRVTRGGEATLWYVDPDAVVAGRSIADAGRVVSIDGQPVGDVEDVDRLLSGARAGERAGERAGDRAGARAGERAPERVTLVLATAMGGERTVRAQLEARDRVEVTLRLREDATAAQLAIRRGITAPTKQR